MNILLVTARPLEADDRYRSIQDRLPGHRPAPHRSRTGGSRFGNYARSTVPPFHRSTAPPTHRRTDAPLLATDAIPAAPGVFGAFRGTVHPRRWEVTMKTLIVRHVDQSDPAQFQVVRLTDGKTIGPVVVSSPVGFPVAGRPNSDLMRELPWEALRDPEAGVLARTCQVQRQLNRLRDPHPLSDQLPRGRVNILLVTARPFDADVRYRSISRPLVDQIDALRLPASVTILRPPTFDALRDHLRKWPHHYHILHFDGHGAYGAALGHPNPYALQGLQGQLVFEDEQGKPDPQTAEVLSELLRDCSDCWGSCAAGRAVVSQSAGDR